MSETTTPTEDALQSSRRTIGYGLCWGGVMLAILGRWLDAKHPTLPGFVAYLFYAWAGVLLGHGLQQLLTLKKPASPQQLLNERRLAGLTLCLWGVLAILAALGLAVWQAMQGSGGFTFSRLMEAFPEAFGLAVLGFISLGAGRAQLRQPGAATASRTLENLLPKIPALSICLLILTACFIGLAAWLLLIRKVGWDGFPEAGMFILLALIGLGAGLWLRAKPKEEITADRLRIFFLVIGGLAGLVIAVMTIARAWMWREEYFFGGLSAWQREGAWRIWLLGYMELIGLTLMFGSLLLARADIRKNAVLRRTLYGYNAVVNGLLVIAILVVLNIVAYAALPYRFDWTGDRGIYTLHPATKNVLAGLKEPVTAYVIFQQGIEGFGDLRTLLDNAQAETNLLHVRFVSPGTDFEQYQKLAMRFPEIRPDQQMARFGEARGGILLISGMTPSDVDAIDPKKGPAELAKIPHTFIADTKIFDSQMNPHAKDQKKLFKGEEELVKEMRFLGENKTKRKVYFLQGNDELDINVTDPVPRAGNLWMPMRKLGIGELVRRLEADNFEVQGLDFGKKPLGKPEPKTTYVEPSGADKHKEVPDDAWAVVVPAPGKPVDKDTIDALDRYMQKKGRMILLLDIVSEKDSKTIPATGLEEFAARYGVQVTNDFVLRVPEVQGDRGLWQVNVYTPDESKSTLAKRFENLTVFATARVVKPAPGKGPFRAEAFFVAASNPRIQELWFESDLAALSNPFDHFVALFKSKQIVKKISEQPLPVSVTVSEGDKPRMVVMGDADFITNEFLTRLRDRDVYYGIFSSSLDWLGDRPIIGIPPKQTNTFSLPSGVEVSRLVLMPILLMGVSIVGLGVGVWVVRRR